VKDKFKVKANDKFILGKLFNFNTIITNIKYFEVFIFIYFLLIFRQSFLFIEFFKDFK